MPDRYWEWVAVWGGGASVHQHPEGMKAQGWVGQEQAAGRGTGVSLVTGTIPCSLVVCLCRQVRPPSGPMAVLTQWCCALIGVLFFWLKW